MRKKSNTTTKKSFRANNDFGYWDAFSFRQKPVSDAFLINLITDGIKWAQTNDRAYKVSTFFKERGICANDIKRWCERLEDFARGYQFMKEIIGDRREIGALEKKLDAGIVSRSMHRYDSEWLEIDQHHADLRKKEEELGSKNITVILQSAENTDVKPLKKTK